MKSFLVIGMGKFGQHLAQKLIERGNEVMVVDSDPVLIGEISHNFTDAEIGDCTNVEVLKALGVSNFDICFVAIGENFQSSLEITSLLHECGAKKVISKANKEIQVKFLLRNGADEVVYPERDIAEKMAIRHSAKNVFDYVELTPEYAMYEISVPNSWVGKTIGTINIRHRYGVNILAIKHSDNTLIPVPGADYEFLADDHVNVVGRESDIAHMSEKM